MAIKLDVLPSTNSSCGLKNPLASQEPPPEEFAPIAREKGCGCDITRRVALMLTRRCNMSCGHCSVESSPHIKGEPSYEELLQIVRDTARAGVLSILLTGGEPMLREEVVLNLLRECQTLDVVISMTTNGFWGKKLDKAQQKVAELKKAGLKLVTVSYDRYHAEFMGVEPILNIAQAAREHNLAMNISVTRVEGDTTMGALVAPFAELTNVRMRFYDVQPLGRARNLDASTLRAEVKGFCNACDSPAITDDGRVTACNGPSYFAKPDSPLAIGSLREESLSTLLQRHRNDPILETLRTLGPARMVEQLRQTGGFESLLDGPPLSGMCDLCHRITNNPDAVNALREQLSDTRHIAERHAVRQVISKGRATGSVLNLNHVNGAGAARIFLRAARNSHRDSAARWEPDTATILGRADVDWSNLVRLILGNELARPLLPALNDPQLTRWAPEFFAERLRVAAQRDAVREAAGRKALEHLAEGLRAVDARGVLLKGAALAAVAAASPQDKRVPRSSCDIDLWVEPHKAVALREHLLAHGFTGTFHHARTKKNAHHLSPVLYKGVMVEIHTRITRSIWGLPEAEMLERARPVADVATHPRLAGLHALDDESLLVHALIHVTHHGFRFGLKAAWDIAWILDTHPNLDWERVARWVRGCNMPLGFLVPARVLCRELGLKLPAELIEMTTPGTESDLRATGLDDLATGFLFGTAPPSTEKELSKRNTMWLLLHETRWSRTKCLGRYLLADVRDIRRRKRAVASDTSESSSMVGSRPLWRTRRVMRNYRKLRQPSCTM